MAIYYVDTVNGSDANIGSAIASPWKTLAKVNSSIFAPGDSALLKCGCLWREILAPPSSGVSGSNITFGAYGIGELPKIYGSALISGVEIQTRTRCVDNGSNYITIKDLELAYATDLGVLVYTQRGWIIDGCHIHHIGVKNGSLDEGVHCKGADVIIQNCIIHDCGNHGISLCADSGQTLSNALVQNSVFYDNYHSDIDCQCNGGRFSGVILRYNEHYNTSEFDKSYEAGAIYVLADHPAPGGITGVEIYYNNIHNKNGTGIVIRGAVANPKILNNAINGFLPGSVSYAAGIAVFSNNAGIADPSSVVIRSNTVMDVHDQCLYVTNKSYISECDYNCWYQSAGGVATFVTVAGVSYHFDDFVAYKAATGWDTNGRWTSLGGKYYIDPILGNDANSGSIANPWKTYEKVRATIVAGTTAGDQFLFKRGEIFSPAIAGANWSCLNINGRSGNSGAYCVIGAYGVGETPIIDERYVPTGSWTDDGSNKWHIVLAWAVGDVKRVFLDGVESVEAANSGAINGTDHLWFYNKTTHILYLYSTSDPGGRMVFLVPQAGCIWTSNSNYWKFENIEWRGAGYSVFELGPTACSYLEWNGCEFTYGSGPSIINFNNLPGDGHNHLTINGCTFDWKGALISKAVTQAELGDTWGYDLLKFDCSVNDVMVIDCTFRDGYHSQINIVVSTNTIGNGVHRVAISGSRFFGINSPYIRPFCLAGSASKCGNNSFVYNYINNVNVRTQIGGKGNLVAYNIWDTVRANEEVTTARGNAFNLYAISPDVCIDNLVCNNIFYNVDMEGIWLGQNNGDFTGNLLANNILWNCGRRTVDNSPYRVGAAITVDPGTSETNRLYNNCIYNSSETRVITHKGTRYTVAQAQASAPAVYKDNIQSDPLLVSPTNFRSTPFSPCVGAGIDVGLIHDYDGYPIVGLPDIGVYEHQEEQMAIKKTVPLTLVVTAAPDFFPAVVPASISVVKGTVAAYHVSFTAQGGFIGPVKLAVINLPSGAVATFDKTSISLGETSTLSITTAAVAVGTFPFSLEADPNV